MKILQIMLLVFFNILLIILFVFIYFYFVNTTDKFILEGKKEKLKSVTDVVYTLADNFEQQYRKNNNLDLKKLQEEFINLTLKMRYDSNEYFFIIDGKGNLIIDPFRPELSWWNLMYEVDSRGEHLYKKLVIQAQKENEIFINTLWHSKYNDEVFEEQIIYGRYYWPWDWIICTTLYTEDKPETMFSNKLPILISLFIFYIMFNFVFILITKTMLSRKQI